MVCTLPSALASVLRPVLLGVHPHDVAGVAQACTLHPSLQAALAGAARLLEEQAAAGWHATAGALPPQGPVVTAYMLQREFKP